MHILFVHSNFPAQFGEIAGHLVEHHQCQCTFLSTHPPAEVFGIRRIQYKTKGGPTAQTHYCSRKFEEATWHALAVYETLKAHSDVQPDLVVGHSGFGSTLYLADLYDCPIINYFEYYYPSGASDSRKEFPPPQISMLRARSRNAIFLLDLQTCAAGYCPTNWQRSLFPSEYQHKLETIFDGIDLSFWTRRKVPRRIGKQTIPQETRIVTWVSRGFESMRGADIFMRVAKRICDERKNVIFVVVGSDRVCYGGDLKYIKESTFREHVLAQDDYDLDRILFTGMVPPSQLVEILSLSDLHIYLTTPFVLSWSLMNALACGCTVLASRTPPVEEMIRHQENGLLADFYDVDRFTELALEVLDAPESFRHLAQAGVRLIEQHYSLAKTLPKTLDLYRRTVNAGKG